jgi:uncharacterized phage protein (TIGR02220 family)
MNHSFNIEVAKEYGVDCAIVLEHLNFWIKKNEANGKHFYDGRYWTYNSIKAFSELFPYWSESQIRRILIKLEDSNLILTGNFNKAGYDMTKWYAVNDSLILRNRQMDLMKSSNGFDEIVKPIPDINTYINTDITSNVTGFEKPDEIDWNGLISFFNKVTGKKTRVIGSKAKRQFKKRLEEGFKKEDIISAIKNCFNDPYHKKNPHYLTLEFISREDKLAKYSDYKKAEVKLPDDWFFRELTQEQKEILPPEKLKSWNLNKMKTELEGGKLRPIER